MRAWCSTHPSSDPPPPGWLATGLGSYLPLKVRGGRFVLVTDSQSYQRLTVVDLLYNRSLFTGIDLGDSEVVREDTCPPDYRSSFPGP